MVIHDRQLCVPLIRACLRRKMLRDRQSGLVRERRKRKVDFYRDRMGIVYVSVEPIPASVQRLLRMHAEENNTPKQIQIHSHRFNTNTQCRTKKTTVRCFSYKMARTLWDRFILGLVLP